MSLNWEGDDRVGRMMQDQELFARTCEIRRSPLNWQNLLAGAVLWAMIIGLGWLFWRAV